MSKYRNMQNKPLSLDTADGNAVSVGARGVFEVDDATASTPRFKKKLNADEIRLIGAKEHAGPVAKVEPAGPPVLLAPRASLVVSVPVVEPKQPEPTFDVPGSDHLADPSTSVASDDVPDLTATEPESAEPKGDESYGSGEPEPEPRERATSRGLRKRRNKHKE